MSSKKTLEHIGAIAERILEKLHARGTPTSLTGAIQNAMEEIALLNIPASKAVAVFQKHIRDFNAQHFTAAMGPQIDEKEIARLQALFRAITEDKK